MPESGGEGRSIRLRQIQLRLVQGDPQDICGTDRDEALPHDSEIAESHSLPNGTIHERIFQEIGNHQRH